MTIKTFTQKMEKLHFQKKSILLLAELFLTAFCLNAEAFRVHKNIVHELPLSNEGKSFQLGINDSFSIFYPGELIYVQGIALDIKIPQLAATWRDSMAWSVYDSVTPVPQAAVIDYSGKPLKFGLLPPRLSWSIVIPLADSNLIKETPYYTKMDLNLNTSNNYLFFRLQQVMKGTPDEFENIKFDVTVKPILANLGKFELTLKAPDEAEALKQCAFFMDEKPFNPEEKGNYIESGIHTFSLVSEFYRSEVRTVHIDQAKTTQLLIKLRSIEPSVMISAPVSSTVYFDEQEVEPDSREFTITEGEHIVRFTLGNYDVEKKFTAIKGQSYNVSLNIEAVISEEE